MAVSSVGWRSIDDDAAVDAATRALFAFNKKRKKNVPGSQTGNAREGGGAGSARRDPIGIASASVDVSRLVSTPFVSSID
jgi:hypothetical protein